MTILDVLRDMMLGGRHSRRTVARGGVSLPTADRWLVALYRTVPGMLRKKAGKVTWYEWDMRPGRRDQASRKGE